MKRLAILWVIIILVGFYAWWLLRTDKGLSNAINIIPPTPSVTEQPNQTIAKTSLFVPYWSLSSQQTVPTTYDTYLYFGIQATRSGIDTAEAGYINLPLFLSATPSNSNKLLVIRMIDNTENSAILGNQTAQKNIIAQTVKIAKENGFNGVVLDLEMSAIPFDSLIQQINTFNDGFSQAARQDNLTYSITMYGDTFYRPRPFDLKHLAADAGTIYIMSYDLHKASGNPGSNFPIATTSEDEYDLSKMLTDYEAVVPKSKLAIVFGLFGYDWPIDAKGNAEGTGSALSYEDIENKFILTCAEKNCLLKYDSASGENIETYTDKQNQNHIIWFDGPKSVQTKEVFLKTRGIQDFSFWAWSYF